MTTDNQKLGQPLAHGLVSEKDHATELGHNMGQVSGGGSTLAVDFAFLSAQTFADTALERDVLALFVAQARDVLPKLPALTPKGQDDAAHLLKGSARGIGAWAAAAAAEDYENTAPEARHLALAVLVGAFATVEAAIGTRLSCLES